MRSQKGTSLGGNASFVPLALNHVNRFTRSTCGGEQENNMKGKGWKKGKGSHA
jgi:hypothetical protein